MVTASPISANGSYPPAPNPPPPPPAIMESYPPPPAPPTLVDAYQPAHYYQSAYGLPPTCYSHSPTRAIPYISKCLVFHILFFSIGNYKDFSLA